MSIERTLRNKDKPFYIAAAECSEGRACATAGSWEIGDEPIIRAFAAVNRYVACADTAQC